MVRIGEIAALVGVSARAVRHYHRRGLLPEPKRLANGYRSYELRDVVVLARIRRLTELGLTLDEVRDALGDSRDLREILVELDADLAAQEARLRERRARLAGLIARTEPHADDAVAPELLAFLDELDDRTKLGGLERDLYALLDTLATPEDRDRAMRAHTTDPELAQRLEALADADVDDPRVPELAAEIADMLPPMDFTGDAGAFGDAVLDALSPAQSEVIRQVLRRLAAP